MSSENHFAKMISGWNLVYLCKTLWEIHSDFLTKLCRFPVKIHQSDLMPWNKKNLSLSYKCRVKTILPRWYLVETWYICVKLCEESENHSDFLTKLCRFPVKIHQSDLMLWKTKKSVTLIQMSSENHFAKMISDWNLVHLCKTMWEIRKSLWFFDKTM
jgi:hypothetical protein